MDMHATGYLLQDITFFYGNRPCLQNISIHLEPGCLYGLIGPNGSGKSTLLDIMSGFSSADLGTVRLDGQELGTFSEKQRAKLITAVPQSISLNFDYTVFDVVLMGRYPHMRRLAGPAEYDLEVVEQAVRTMGIWSLRHRPVRALSGGEKQRVMIARALAQDCSYILLDEVTANLDISHAISIMKTMTRMVRENGRTIIAALHDLNMALAFCDRIIALQDGSIFRFGNTDEVVSQTLVRQLYHVEAELCHAAGAETTIHYRYHA